MSVTPRIHRRQDRGCTQHIEASFDNARYLLPSGLLHFIARYASFAERKLSLV